MAHIDIISADSVAFMIDSIAQARQAAEVTLFGSESTLVESAEPLVYTPDNLGVESITANPLYIVLSVAFILLYLVWLPHIIKGGSVKWEMLRRSRNGEGEMIGKQRLGMVVATWMLGIAMFSLLAARLLAQFSYPYVILFDGWDWIVGGVVAVVAIILYWWFAMKSIGYIIINTSFAHKLLSIKREMLFLSIMLLSPLFIISSLANFEQGGLVAQLSVVVLVVVLLLFIRKSFLLFMRQNFSILHWFLYLCGVEILPLTFLWSMMTRYVGA